MDSILNPVVRGLDKIFESVGSNNSWQRVAGWLATAWWILTLPYEWLTKDLEGEALDFRQHGGNSGLGGVIVTICFLPYLIYHETTDSFLGRSDFDEEALKTYFTLGWMTLLLLFVGIVLLCH